MRIPSDGLTLCLNCWYRQVSHPNQGTLGKPGPIAVNQRIELLKAEVQCHSHLNSGAPFFLKKKKKKKGKEKKERERQMTKEKKNKNSVDVIGWNEI